jgi:hypothetical protein
MVAPTGAAIALSPAFGKQEMPHFAGFSRRKGASMPLMLEHDPEKCEAVFRKDHAQTQSESAMTNQPNIIAL